VKRKGRVKQGITQGVFGRGSSLSLEDQCREASRLGIKGYDFIDDPADWPMLKRYGLTLSMWRLDYPRWKDGANGRGKMPPRPPARAPGAAPAPPQPRQAVPVGWGAIAQKEATGDFQKSLHTAIDMAAAAGIPNIILLAGSRVPGLSDQQGAENAIAFCNQVKAHAEDKNIVLCPELISSKGGPGTYMFDHFAWGIDVVKQVNSPHVKILYDIYHAQVMDGNIVETIRNNIQWIGHFHTGGVPGRHELDETQELNWPFIVEAIMDLKYTGFITHEWSPTPGKDPIASLDKVIGIIDV
jgi:hydroxypyruvate isomerase